MKKIIIEGGVDVLSWCENIEDSAMEQIENAARHPKVFGHIALMPDCHMGYGICIGGVMALKDAICPNAVGKDISCGMRAVKTNIRLIPGKHSDDSIKQQLIDTKALIEARIPTGFHTNARTKDHRFKIDDCFDVLSIISDIFSKSYKKKVEKSIGTLGGGNHHIEITKDLNGYLWVHIHSGSRNFGATIAYYFDKIARKLNPYGDLSYFEAGTQEFDDYLIAMTYAMEYAEENRRVMMVDVKRSIRDAFNMCVKFDEEIDINHNYASVENVRGELVFVHRKGATYAGKGNVGIIPGSQGTKSYIVRGLGNADSLNSCSHGAGRAMSRTKATLNLDLAEQEEKMRGIIHSKPSKITRGSKKVRGMYDLGECPDAYKDIDKVMDSQKDLVEIVETLTPLMSVKDVGKSGR